jgi:hypothetical protein
MRKHIHFVRLYVYLVRAEIPTTSGLEVATTPTNNNTITAENTQTHFWGTAIVILSLLLSLSAWKDLRIERNKRKRKGQGEKKEPKV